MLYLYHHHDLQRLAELLAVLMQRERPASPLAKERVIVVNPGMGRWLQGQLAASDGIAANIEFVLPARFIWAELLGELVASGAGADYFRERLRWHLYRLLPDAARQDPAVAGYLDAELPEIQRLQLADRVADVFDQYQVFRGDMLARWEAGATAAESGTERWQSRLWRMLVRSLGTEHRPALLRQMARQLGAAPWPTGDDRVFCFGTASLPPDYLRLFHALGRTRDVHLLLPNPSDVYWGDIRAARLPQGFTEDAGALPAEAGIEAGHPLLAALGRPTRDFIRLLYSDEMTAIQEPELGEALAYEPPGADTLLHRIQRAVIRLELPAGEDPPRDEADVSLQVHRCHGALREVQVLHDQLLSLLAADPELQPRDIVVMMPDPPAYAPAVRGVFGAAQGRRYIPWSLSGRPRSGVHPVVQAFRELLDLPLSRWAAPEVMGFASVPAVMRRFGLDSAGLELLRHWVAESGIRWGLDAGTRARFGAGELDANTWRFGLDRLLLGSVMDDSSALVADVAPWADLEGGSVEVLGRLHRLIFELERWQRVLESARSPGAWLREFNILFERMFLAAPDDRDEGDAFAAIRDALQALQSAEDCLDGEALPWRVVREVLDSELAQPAARQPFLSGGVTFTDLETLAGVPFRVVCLLGMNDGAFPRQDGGREFNLMLQRRRLGDRGNRDADRQFFLQALLAARDVFYLSHTGRDVRSGEPLEPATPVAEFLDFVRRHHCRGWSREDLQSLVTDQPMQPFSRRYFLPDRNRSPLVFTFAGDWRAGADAGEGARVGRAGLLDGSFAAVETPAVIGLDQMRAFFRHPARAFLRERLGLWLDEADLGLEDSERFALGPLEAWSLRSALLDNPDVMPDALTDEPPRFWQRSGMLPPAPLDGIAWRAQAEAVRALLPVRESWHRGPVGDCDIDLMLAGGVRLVGRLTDLRPGGLYRLRAGSLALRGILADWIDYLALAASGEPAALHLAGIRQGKPDLRRARASSVDARETLQRMVEWFIEGRRRPLPFHPDLAELWLEQRMRGLERGADSAQAELEALDLVRKKLCPETGPSHHVAADPYFALLLDPDAPLESAAEADDFRQLTDTVCGLLHQRLELLPVGDAPDV